MFVPVIAYAENYTVKTENQTITIVIKPDDIIFKPNTTIVLKPNYTIAQNDTKIERLIENLPKNQSSYTQGDILISSATIIGLFSVSSFITSKFSESTKTITAKILNAAMVISGTVMVIQIYIMIIVVLGFFSPLLYTVTMSFTGLAVLFVIILIGRLIRLESRFGKRSDVRLDVNRLIDEYRVFRQNNDS